MTTAVRAPSAARRRLAEEFLALLPALKLRFQTALPDALRDEIAGTTPHQLEALHLLRLTRHGPSETGATMNELARRQGCATSTATALVDRLLRQGLAERVADPSDRRVVRIAPTERGERLCEQFADARRDIGLAALEGLTNEEIETLVRLLRKVAGEDPHGTHGGAER